MLKEMANDEAKLQQDKHDKLLLGIRTFNDQLAALEEKHAREIVALGVNATADQLAALRRKQNQELNDLREDFRKEYTEQLSGINSKEDLERQYAELTTFWVNKETELQRKILNIGIKAAKDRIKVLEKEQIDLGVDNSVAIAAENAFISNSESHLDQLTKNYIIIGEELGSLLSQSSDEFVAKIGRMISELSSSISQIQSGGSLLDKGVGLVGVVTSIANAGFNMAKKRRESEIEDLKAMTQEVANRISFEAEVNKLYAQRARDANDNIFIGPDFSETINDAIEESQKAAELYDETMEALVDKAILTATGKADKKFLGIKTGSKSNEEHFTFADILSEAGFANAGAEEQGKLFSSGINEKIAKDAWVKLRTISEEALSAMGKSIEDFNSLSNDEMLEFFELMESGGHITDSATKQLISDAKEAAQVMKEAEDAINSLIDTMAGDLGSNLRNALVEAFKAGEDAADAFEKAVGQTLENIVSQMIFDQVFRKSFADLEKQMQASLGVNAEGELIGGGDNDLTDDLVRFYQQAGANAEAYTDALEAAKKAAAAQGIDILGGGEEPAPASPLVGAIKGITADQADLLAGQFAGMRLVNLEMLELDKVRNSMMGQYSELMTDQLASLNLIVFNTGATATNTARLESIEVTLKSMNNKMNSSQNALEASGIGG